jgi:hypothetical protein
LLAVKQRAFESSSLQAFINRNVMAVLVKRQDFFKCARFLRQLHVAAVSSIDHLGAAQEAVVIADVFRNWVASGWLILKILGRLRVIISINLGRWRRHQR